jgi:hypothetical protein
MRLTEEHKYACHAMRSRRVQERVIISPLYCLIFSVALAGGTSAQDSDDSPGFSDVRIMTPTILSIAAVIITVAAVYIFLKRSKYMIPLP